MPVYDWSHVNNTNATADPTINYQIGMAPSAVGASGRAMMAAVAQYRDDIAGAIVTAGISTAYTVSSYSGYTSLAQLAGQMIAFTPHATNAAVVTLNVDSLGPKPLRTSPGVELLAGTIIQGTPYCAVYNNSDGAFYLQGFFGNPYNVPLCAGLDFWGSTAPNSSFVFPFGQAISRTTYATAFALLSTTYGAGDGLTTFNLPDLRGRVAAAMDDMGGAAAGRLGAVIPGTTLGGAGGAELTRCKSAKCHHIITGSTIRVIRTAGYLIPATGWRTKEAFRPRYGKAGAPEAQLALKPASQSSTTAAARRTVLRSQQSSVTTSCGLFSRLLHSRGRWWRRRTESIAGNHRR